MVATPTQDEDIIVNLTKQVADLQKKVKTLEALPADNLEIKTTTGDFTVGSSWTGRRVVNTADANYKILIGGAWQVIV